MRQIYMEPHKSTRIYHKKSDNIIRLTGNLCNVQTISILYNFFVFFYLNMKFDNFVSYA